MMLPIVSNSLVYKDEFMLADNFNSPFDIETAARFMNSSHPFKINFTMALLCFKGSIRIRLNLEEHLLQTNDVLTILPGYIGECLEISRDCKIVLIAYTWKRRFGESSATYSIAVFNRITKFPLLRMQPGKMEEIMAIYRLMRRRMQDTGFQYTGEALGGYMQVLASIFYQRVHEDLEQTPEPEAWIPAEPTAEVKILAGEKPEKMPEAEALEEKPEEMQAVKPGRIRAVRPEQQRLSHRK